VLRRRSRQKESRRSSDRGRNGWRSAREEARRAERLTTSQPTRRWRRPGGRKAVMQGKPPAYCTASPSPPRNLVTTAGVRTTFSSLATPQTRTYPRKTKPCEKHDADEGRQAKIMFAARIRRRSSGHKALDRLAAVRPNPKRLERRHRSGGSSGRRQRFARWRGRYRADGIATDAAEARCIRRRPTAWRTEAKQRRRPRTARWPDPLRPNKHT